MAECPSGSHSRRHLMRTLWRIGFRYLARHPWQSGLMILGISLGVAVIVAVDLANTGALRAFEYSADAVAGRTTHEIVAGPQGFSEEIYVNLHRKGLMPAAAPVVTELVSSPELGHQPLQLLGVDPFAEAPFRDYLWSDQPLPIADLVTFLTRPGAIMISSDLAERYSLLPGQSIALDVGGYTHPAIIAGILQPAGSLSRRALEGMILADIATAQELTGRIGTLDRIDLILPADGIQRQRITDSLPAGLRIVPATARSGTIEEMTSAFRVNLTALSLLALVVGTLLIYNTMTFSIVQRRSLFGTLRSLGVTPREVFGIVIVEALIIGTLGTVLGLAFGLLLGLGTVRLVSQTISDVYFVLVVREAPINAVSLLKGAILGILVTVATAAPPAWEAASVSPRAALSRSGMEAKAQRAVLRAAAGGLILAGLAVGLLALPTRSLEIGFAGTSAAVLAFATLAPGATTLLMRAVAPLGGRWLGVLGRMAPRDVTNSLSRTAIAIAALMVAVSVSIGVSLMVGSFRHTVTAWMDQALQGDIYVQTPSLAATQAPTAPLDPLVLETVRSWPGVERVDLLRSTTIDSSDGPVTVFAIDNPNFPERPFLAAQGSPQEIWQAMLEGAVTVSEPLALRTGLPLGDGTITLYTDNGPREFPIAGIYHDYVSNLGTVSLSLDTYRAHWKDGAVTSLALHLAPDAGLDAVTQGLREALASPSRRVLVRPNQALRQDVLTIFDRTFLITSALQALATIVAFIGVLSALLSVQLERQRELGILRAIGLTQRQLWGLVQLETGLMGTAAGLLAMPTGLVLALILVYIINRRAFGWTLLLQIEPLPFVQALAVAVLAAMLAGVYPAWKMGRTVTADALRYE